MAKDFYHELVKEALQKSGWTITHDPYKLSEEIMRYEVDFGAEQMFAAEKGPEKIAVEVKNFLGPSLVNELHRTVGQYVNYRAILRKQEEDRHLFVAIPRHAWKTFFQREPVQLSLLDLNPKIVVFDEDEKSIIEWISS
ncbi:MAG: element excision factor XisH family protein [Bacteroidota bacterium]